MKTLPKQFYTMPKFAHTTMDKKDLKELLLNTGSYIIACGKLYGIKTKSLGAGIYKVYLKEKKKLSYKSLSINGATGLKE